MRALPTLFFVSLAAYALADTVEIKDFMYSEPLPLIQSVALGDTAGINSDNDYLKLPIDINSLPMSPARHDLRSNTLNVFTADFENRKYTEAKITVDSLSDYQMYLDGKEIATGSKVKLHPGTHRVALKFKYSSDASEINPTIKIDTEGAGVISAVTDGRRMFTLDDVLYGVRISDASLSPSGSYILVSYTDTRDGGKTKSFRRLYDVKRGEFISTFDDYARWMPKSDKYIIEAADYQHGRHIICVNPTDGTRQILASNLPDGHYIVSPTEDFLIFSLVRKGEKEDPEIYRIIEPEDRQPGWRDRTYPAIFRFDNPVLQPLAISKNDLSTVDISDDGTKLLLLSSSRRMTKRPTTLYSLISLDLNTMEADTIVDHDGFISGAYFSPDASHVIVTASPEAFDRVGCTLPEGVIPSAYDYQLYDIDISSGKVRPLTRDFNPSINDSEWCRYDGNIYMTCTERDMYTLYALNPATGEITPIDIPENVIKGISLSSKSPVMAVWGQSDSNPDALYTYNIKSGKSTAIDKPSQSRLADVRLGKCIDWKYLNPRGEEVYARYYLPDNFDPSKKYPLIVNYYGGCTPSTRNFESRYPMHVYSSLGYVTLVIQPSGATGFGQEWSSRHVSTAGKGVAEDIIAGTEQFCKEMDFIDADKIGCIGASYGGFMTQYLLTQTDIFATAISHAGISDHTSYWGEGYWGYSYSEVSMGEDLPWTNTELYVNQSPLYNADKIHTPILFLHGDSDTNVPVGESIQMFTALKLLGVDTSLVEVAGQDHHIKADSQRKKWQDTIFAWFAKYLQDDATWWESLYPTYNY